MGLAMKRLLVILAGLLPGTLIAADFACMEDCYRRGYAQNHCMAICGGAAGQGGLLDQPGLPKNPGFNQVNPQNDAYKQQQRLPRVADKRCMSDCQRKGYDFMLCRKQCSYEPTY